MTATIVTEVRQKTALPYRFQRKHGSADSQFSTFSLHNCETVNFYCFNPPLL